MYNDIKMILIDFLWFQASTKNLFQDQTKRIVGKAAIEVNMPPLPKTARGLRSRWTFTAKWWIIVNFLDVRKILLEKIKFWV